MTVKRIWLICTAIILIFIVSSCGNAEPQAQTTAIVSEDNSVASESLAMSTQTQPTESAKPQTTTQTTTEEVISSEPSETATESTLPITADSDEPKSVNTDKLIESIIKAYGDYEQFSYSIGIERDTKAQDFSLLDGLFSGIADYRFEEIPDPELDIPASAQIIFGETWSLFDDTPHIRFFDVDKGIIEFRNGNGQIYYYAVSGIPYSGESLYDLLVANYYRVEAKRLSTIYAETAEIAVQRFITREFFFRELYASPENSQKIVNYSVLKYNIVEISEDSNSVTLTFTYRVKPADINSYMYAGATHRLHGEWEGWLESEAKYKLSCNNEDFLWDYEQIWN